MKRDASRRWWRRPAVRGTRGWAVGPAIPTSTPARSASRSTMRATNSGALTFPRCRCRPWRRSVSISWRAGLFRQSASSHIPTSPPGASAIPVRSSTGRGWPAQASDCGWSRRRWPVTLVSARAMRTKRSPRCNRACVSSATAWRSPPPSARAWNRSWRPSSGTSVPPVSTAAPTSQPARPWRGCWRRARRHPRQKAKGPAPNAERAPIAMVFAVSLLQGDESSVRLAELFREKQRRLLVVVIEGLGLGEVGLGILHEQGLGLLVAEAIGLAVDLGVDGAVRLDLLIERQTHGAHIVVLAGGGEGGRGKQERAGKRGNEIDRLHRYFLQVVLCGNTHARGVEPFCAWRHTTRRQRANCVIGVT